MFALLCEAFPGRYQEGQLRTLQRHVQAWRERHGPEQEVMFPQEHVPGRMAQSDFTSMNALGIGIAGTSFPDLVYHLVLTYSNVEAVRVCFSESFEALAEGLEGCLWQIGWQTRRQHRLPFSETAIDEASPRTASKETTSIPWPIAASLHLYDISALLLVLCLSYLADYGVIGIAICVGYRYPLERQPLSKQ